MPLSKCITQMTFHINTATDELDLDRFIVEYCVCVDDEPDFKRYGNIVASGLELSDTLSGMFFDVLEQVETKEGI